MRLSAVQPTMEMVPVDQCIEHVRASWGFEFGVVIVCVALFSFFVGCLLTWRASR